MRQESWIKVEKTLGAVAHAAQAAGVACETVQVEHEHPYQAIIDTAGSKGCDLIVMASHGRHGISAIVLGSDTVKVLTHCFNGVSRAADSSNPLTALDHFHQHGLGIAVHMLQLSAQNSAFSMSAYPTQIHGRNQF